MKHAAFFFSISPRRQERRRELPLQWRLRARGSEDHPCVCACRRPVDLAPKFRKRCGCHPILRIQQNETVERLRWLCLEKVDERRVMDFDSVRPRMDHVVNSAVEIGRDRLTAQRIVAAREIALLYD